ncbi:MAG: methyltransferase domain-containing protein [Actinomycetota bacterium]|nr:methyltransferase domain-containing protein [Actinomycetota bacterium]
MAGYEAGSFGGGIDAWLARRGKLRNVVRQELVARQLARHLPPPPATVLDVGAGQGTQALRLAERGDRVLAVEPDPAMRAAFAVELDELSAEIVARVVLADGLLGELADATGGATFDVVCCQGVLMYLDNATPAVAELAAAVAPGGLLSIVVRNADGMALRPGLRRDWDGVQRMLNAAEQDLVGAAADVRS